MNSLAQSYIQAGRKKVSNKELAEVNEIANHLQALLQRKQNPFYQQGAPEAIPLLGDLLNSIKAEDKETCLYLEKVISHLEPRIVIDALKVEKKGGTIRLSITFALIGQEDRMRQLHFMLNKYNEVRFYE